MPRNTYSRNVKSSKPLTPCDIYSALTNGPPSYGGMISSGTSTTAPYITYSYTNVSISSQRS